MLKKASASTPQELYKAAMKEVGGVLTEKQRRTIENFVSAYPGFTPLATAMLKTSQALLDFTGNAREITLNVINATGYNYTLAFSRTDQAGLLAKTIRERAALQCNQS